MPRKARITVPGAVHHVMSRGIEGHSKFRNDNDRSLLIGLLEKNLLKSGYLLYAWCLMDNHNHLILSTNEFPSGEFMRLVNGVYEKVDKNFGTESKYQNKRPSIKTFRFSWSRQRFFLYY